MRSSLLINLLWLAPLAAGAQHADQYKAPASDVAAVTAASFGYIDALYKVDSTLVIKHVHPALAKRGFYQVSGGSWQDGTMTYAQLLSLSARWNKEGKEAGPKSPREVKVLEVMNRTAITRVTAEWGIDYLALGKYEDGWKIVNIIWQSPPR